ncbi:hypothetical protein [Trabulsiella odontotermitis]|uniref:protein YnhH n=1 Tax=Trabulsiella odontotermitis TaxID=379893 RepID=UPI003AEFB3BF
MDCLIQQLKKRLRHRAETLAHFPQHAFLMSPILTAWHYNFRNTGLSPWQSARRARFPHSSQLKD